MNAGAPSYLLKEYGSWAVLIVAFATGLGVSRSAPLEALVLLPALGLLVNAKQAFTSWQRPSGSRRDFAVFSGQAGLAALLLLVLFGRQFPQLLPLLVFPAAYLLMNRFGGEHHLLTELLGFALLSLAAVLAKFLVVGGVDVRLFVATALYFTAGVFKVRAVLRKKTVDRVLSSLYIAFTAYAYHRFHISLVILLPLLENLFMAAAPYPVRLKTTGWIETAKSLIFLGLMLAWF